MIDLKKGFNYTAVDNRDKRGVVNGQLNQLIFKFKDTKKTRYILLVDKYENDVHFLKFYRQRDETNKEKYKYRHDIPRYDFFRIISTCINVAKDISIKNEEAVFAFFGQWDDKDIIRQKDISRRGSIYRNCVASVIDDNKFKIIQNEKLNYVGFIPKSKYSEQLEFVLYNNFCNWFGEENLIKLITPENNNF
jgi:hypothetical protein